MSKTASIQQEARATLRRLEAKDPGIKQLLKKAYGYAVFPSVGKAALVVGGAYGRGAVFERQKFIGYATIGQTTLGVQIGGDTFSELVVFQTKDALDKLKHGKMAFVANASAVLVKAGAAASKGFGQGTQAYVYGSGGMLLEAAIGGQKFRFKPAGQSSDESEQSEGGESDQEQGGLLDQLGGLRGAASTVSDMMKSHPIATTIAGAGAAAAVAALVLWAMRGSSSDSESQPPQDAAQDSGDDSEDQGEGEEEEAETSGTRNGRF